MRDFAPSLFQVVDVSKRISDVPEWFKGSRLNYAENLLKHKDQDKVALYAASKSRPISELPKSRSAFCGPNKFCVNYY